MAGLLAYSLAPIVKFLERMIPRFLAILIVYLIVLDALSVLFYLIVRTAIVQFVSLSDYVRFLLTPGKSGQFTPLEQILQSFGITQSQIASARDHVVASIEGFAGSVVPLLTGLVGAILDVILVAVLSIYLLADGSRVSDWLRGNMPKPQQGRMTFLLDTLHCDITQNVFLQLYLSLPTLCTDGSLKGWLYRVARNRCLDELRRKRVTPFSHLEVSEGDEDLSPLALLPDTAPLLEDLAERQDVRHLLCQAIRT